MISPPIGSVNLVGGLLLIVFGLVMAFYGRKIAKIITFLVGGVVGALFTYTYIAPRMALEPPLNYVAAFAAFIVVGLLAIVLLYLSAGIAAGAATYLFTKPLFSGWTPIILAAIAFAVVLILFNKVLSVGTAILGGIIVAYGANVLLPLIPPLPLIIAAVVAVIGSYYQLKH